MEILENVENLKKNIGKSGNFIKIRIRNDSCHIEAAVGSSKIKISKYKTKW